MQHSWHTFPSYRYHADVAVSAACLFNFGVSHFFPHEVMQLGSDANLLMTFSSLQVDLDELVGYKSDTAMGHLKLTYGVIANQN